MSNRAERICIRYEPTAPIDSQPCARPNPMCTHLERSALVAQRLLVAGQLDARLGPVGRLACRAGWEGKAPCVAIAV